ncbi:MAG: FkbM family methyltransferase [Paracoccaceae bacterium]
MRFLTHGKSGIELSISDEISSPRVVSEIASGSYEQREMLFAQRMVSSGDRVLELGAGLGFVSTVVCKSIEPSYYAAVEADSRLISHIERTHIKNGVKNVDVINAIFSSDERALSEGHLKFGVSKVFWGSAVHKAGQQNIGTVHVRTENASRFIEENSINVLIIDIEGGELDLFRKLYFGGVAKIILEIHPKVFGQAGVREIFQILDDNDFVYNAQNSAGPVVSFEKIGA